MSFGMRLLPGLCGVLLAGGVLAVSGCNGELPADDEQTPGDDDVETPTASPTACPDADGDGSCDQADCADSDPSIYPEAVEVCEPSAPIDNNCDGKEGCSVDDDRDGYTENGMGTSPGVDCDDTDAGVHPNATEACGNQRDEDCNGIADNTCPSYDDDGDTYSEDAGDCDDSDGSVYPGALEQFDGLDNNCDQVAENPDDPIQLSPGVSLSLGGLGPQYHFGWSIDGIAADPDLLLTSANGDNFADLIIGAPGHGGQERGAAMLVLGQPDWTYQPYVYTFTGSASTDNSGLSVASVGDVNYDGRADFAVGVPFYNTVSQDGGRAYVFFGQDATYIWQDQALDKAAGSNIPGYFSTNYMGYSLSGGNVNGDAFDDVLVGGMGGVDSDTGYAFVVPGIERWATSVQKTSLAYVKGTAGLHLGQSIAFVGDSNGDMTGDFVVSAPGDTTKEGLLYWFPGDAAWQANAAPALATAQGLAMAGSVNGENAGFAVAGNGDINGDGSPDFMVADELTFDTEDPVAWLFLGGDAFVLNKGTPQGRFNDDASVRFVLPVGSKGCPCSVSLDGDLNADGFSDMLIGTAADSRVYLFLGSAAYGLSDDPETLSLADADYVFESLDALEQAGYAVAWAGDLNGDGFGDFAVGAPNATFGANAAAGVVYMMFGFAVGS